jgi:excisionase family DNA binding protein
MSHLQDRRFDPSGISPEILRQLDGLVHAGGAKLVGPNGETILLPQELNELLLFVVESVKRKQAVFLMPADEAFTTQAAANFLGMSRPYLLRILEAGKVPFHRVGTHRRILLSDLIEFQTARNITRSAALSDLTKRLAQEGVYDRQLETGS